MKRLDIPNLPELVIRPSGVWNSRAPLQNYLRHVNRLSRSFAAASIAFAKLTAEAQEVPDTSAKSFLRVKKLGLKARRAWIALRKLVSTEADAMTAGDMTRLWRDAFFDSAEHSLVKQAALFELFAQCWTLNFLLAKVERGEVWSRPERRLVRRCWPFPEDALAPSLPNIAQSIPELEAWLRVAPHISKDPVTGAPITQPIHPLINAWEVISFWRAYRNLVVHQGAMVSHRFLREHGDFYSAFAASFAYVKPLVLGRQLELSDGLIVAVGTAHRKAAWILNDKLVEASAGRRGSPNAQGAIDLSTNGAPMLGEGDHLESLRWIEDPTYRTWLRRSTSEAINVKKHQREGAA